MRFWISSQKGHTSFFAASLNTNFTTSPTSACFSFCCSIPSKNFALASSPSRTLPQRLHVAASIRYIILAYPTWIIGAASSICPKCPGHSPIRPPQVLHLNPGSMTPIRWLTRPSSIGKPSSPYVSGVIIFDALIFLISFGDSSPNFIPFILFSLISDSLL